MPFQNKTYRIYIEYNLTLYEILTLLVGCKRFYTVLNIALFKIFVIKLAHIRNRHFVYLLYRFWNIPMRQIRFYNVYDFFRHFIVD